VSAVWLLWVDVLDFETRFAWWDGAAIGCRGGLIA
jgi:hypothetical protein